LRAAITRGDSPERYQNAIAGELERFAAARPRRYAE